MPNEALQTPLSGFLNLLKPPGISSARAVAIVRSGAGDVKVGHAGTLDPEAAGVLPLMIGKAARLFDDLQSDQKAYIAEIAFGAATDTQDAQGIVVRTGGRVPGESELRALFPQLLGGLQQMPPMYSALKRDGRPLYALAREGKTVERETRAMSLYALELLRMMPRNGALISLRCSKGFYVRTLCHDIGEKIGCPAHMRFLLRTQTGTFALNQSHTLEEVRTATLQGLLEKLLIPAEAALSHLPFAEVPARLRKSFQNGVPLPLDAFPAFTGAALGSRVQLRVGGETKAVSVIADGILKPATWLGD